jgi:hypothetical protein
MFYKILILFLLISGFAVWARQVGNSTPTTITGRFSVESCQKSEDGWGHEIRLCVLKDDASLRDFLLVTSGNGTTSIVEIRQIGKP